MAKTVHNDVLDAALNYLKNNATRMVACSAEPTTFEEANVTYALADVTIDSADFTGPADGDASGRKITINEQTGVTVDAEGDPTHIALLDVDDSKLLYVTEESGAQTLYTGNTCTFPAFSIELADPA